MRFVGNASGSCSTDDCSTRTMMLEQVCVPQL
jgi:hypothetical protein